MAIAVFALRTEATKEETVVPSQGCERVSPLCVAAARVDFSVRQAGCGQAF